MMLGHAVGSGGSVVGVGMRDRKRERERGRGEGIMMETF